MYSHELFMADSSLLDDPRNKKRLTNSFARIHIIGIRRGEETALGGIEKSFVCFKLEIIHEPKRSIGICDNDVELKKVVQKAPFFFF